MKTIQEGMKFELDNFLSDTKQTLTFSDKALAAEKGGAKAPVSEGTTNKEVMRVLIERLTFLNKTDPSNRRIRLLAALNTYILD